MPKASIFIYEHLLASLSCLLACGAAKPIAATFNTDAFSLIALMNSEGLRRGLFILDRELELTKGPLVDLEVRGVPALQYFGSQVWK